jgi:hypothetical protein
VGTHAHRPCRAPFIGTRGTGPRAGRKAMTQIGATALRVFKSDAARARYMAAYDARLRDWPVASGF